MADVVTLRKVQARAKASRQVAAGHFGHKIRRNLSAHGFLIGAVLCFTFFSWYPIVREVIMSFQKAVFGGGYAWAGLTNYVRIFHDPTFWQAWRNTLEFTLLALVIGYAVPFCVAVLLNELPHPANPAPPDLAVGTPAGHRVRQHRDGLRGGRLHLDEHGRGNADLPGRSAEHPRRAVRGS